MRNDRDNNDFGKMVEEVMGKKLRKKVAGKIDGKGKRK